MLFLIGTFGLNFPIFISTMAVTVFHSDARAFGLLSSIMAVGSLSGALFAAGVGNKPSLASLSMGSGVFGLGCTLAALAPGYWWFAAALAVSGAAIDFDQWHQQHHAAFDRTNHFGPRWSLGRGALAGFAATLVAVLVLARRKEPLPA